MDELGDNEDLAAISRRKLNNHCKELVDQSFLEINRKKPLTYTLTAKAAQQFDLV